MCSVMTDLGYRSLSAGGLYEDPTPRQPSSWFFLRLKEIEMLTDQERLTLDVMEGLQ